MPAPLDDITVYYFGEKIKDAPEDWQFRKEVNYISDFYHKMLFGYKPPKTGRICIHLYNYKAWDKPDYNGSICRVLNIIEDDKYLSLSKNERYNYILELVHTACLECVKEFGWDKDIFINAYNEVYKRRFYFHIEYPVKKSRDRKKAAYVKVVKTEHTSSLYLNFPEGNEIRTVKLFEKRNWFWYDSIYAMAKNSKWLDKSFFGVYSKRNGRYGYYSLVDDVIVGKLDFKENDF